MSSECKKCTYFKECPDMVELNSIYCKCHKRIPKDRTISYEELQQKVNQLEEENQRLKDIYTNTIRHLRKIGRDELASWMECQLHPCLGWTPMVSTTNEQKEYGSRDIRTGKLSRINTKE